MWHTVQLGRQMPGETGVPGVRVHQVGTGGTHRHPQIGRQRCDRRIGAVEPRVGRVDRRGVPRLSHAVHVDLDQCAQVSHQFGHVDSGTTVDLGWILPCHHRHPHDDDASARARSSPRKRGKLGGSRMSSRREHREHQWIEVCVRLARAQIGG